MLPESIQVLVLDPSRREQAIAVARKIQPSLVVGSDDRLCRHVTPRQKPRLADLFVGRFAAITPLLWLLFAINLMVFYFVNTWMQTIITPAMVKAGGSAATVQDET